MIWRLWHSTLFCALRFHRSCGGTAYGKRPPYTSMCACRCHMRDAFDEFAFLSSPRCIPPRVLPSGRRNTG